MTARKTSRIQEVLASANKDKTLQLSGALEKSLSAALSSLRKNYGVDNPFVPAGNDSADYFKMFESVAERFKSLGKELLDHRSSFLPFELIENAKKDFENPGSGKSKKISEIIDADTALESYENTFFRLLGMPSLDLEGETAGSGDIRDKALTTVTQKGEKIGWSNSASHRADMEAHTKEVLRKRASAISDRIDFPSSTSYDFLSGSVSSANRLFQAGFTDTDKTKALKNILDMLRDLSITKNRDSASTAMANSLISLMNKNRNVERSAAQGQIEEVAELRLFFGKNPPPGLQPVPMKLFRMLEIALIWLEPDLSGKISQSIKEHLYNQHVNKIENATQMQLQSSSNFWQYSYLLFPPVQDARIATCINDPKKMVAKPFLPESERTVNGYKLRSTLLEAVIRIRLDIVTGFSHEGATLNESGMATAADGNAKPLSLEEMGLLEALLIVRLFSALDGFARDVNKKIKIAHEAQHRTRRSQTPGKRPSSDATPGEIEEKSKSRKQIELEAILLVEESLLLLFGDSSVPEELSIGQEGAARTSGVKDAHLMGSALSVLDVPRRWAEQELGKIKEVQARGADKKVAPSTGALRSQLGVAKGVGSIDLLAYLIALFTAKEVVLLALLSSESYGYLKKEYPKGFFDKFEEETPKMDTGRAVNLIADGAFDAYQLFRFMLTKAKPNFRHSTETDT